MDRNGPVYELRAVVFREDGWWIAQILEYCLATACRTLEEIPAELERFLTGQIVASLESGIEPFKDLPPAPQRFWDLYERSSPEGRHEIRRFRLPEGFPANASVDALIAA